MATIDLISAQERKSQETCRKILEATGKLLAEYDFKYVTVRNICAAGDVAYGSFYHHFQNKENLLYIYGKELFEKNLQNNPYPDWIMENDFISRVLWNCIVFAEFCSAMGKEFVHCIYQDGARDIFDDTYTGVLIPIVRWAFEEGYIQDYEGADVLNNVIKDFRILYQGVIMWWCVQKEDIEPLTDTMIHILLHMLASRKSQKFRDLVPVMLVDHWDYKKDLILTGIPRRD